MAMAPNVAQSPSTFPQKGGNKHQHRPSWFDQMRQRYGEEFLNVIGSQQVFNATLNIFRDMSQGRFDINKDFAYFTDKVFTTQLLQEIDREGCKRFMHYDAMTLYVQMVRNDTYAQQLLEFDKKCCDCFVLIKQSLEACQMQPWGVQENITKLVGLLNKLYRGCI